MLVEYTFHCHVCGHGGGPWAYSTEANEIRAGSWQSPRWLPEAGPQLDATIARSGCCAAEAFRLAAQIRNEAATTLVIPATASVQPHIATWLLAEFATTLVRGRRANQWTLPNPLRARLWPHRLQTVWGDWVIVPDHIKFVSWVRTERARFSIRQGEK
jgi:hypothetical protein